MKTILSVLSGSTLYGTSVSEVADTDVSMIGIEAKEDVLGFLTKDTYTFRTAVENQRSGSEDTDAILYGLKKFLSLVAGANPTLVLLFFAPKSCILSIDKVGEELLSKKHLVLSKKFHATFSGYMQEQYLRLKGERGQKKVVRPELVEKYGFDTKYAGHIVRLGLQGVELLSTGKVSLPMRDEDRRVVVDVRTGKYSLEEIYFLKEKLEKDLNQAYNNSSLPSNPNYFELEGWMIDTYLKHWNAK
jgi:hypothetical protein